MIRKTLFAGSASLLAMTVPMTALYAQNHAHNHAHDHAQSEDTNTDMTVPAYPETRAGDVVEEQFGVAVADPYRWLENDVREDEEVAAWVEAQNAVTDAFLAKIPGREALKQRITELTDYERFGLPQEKGGRYFYTRNDGLQNQSVLYVREGLDGEPRLLIDPNEWSEDDATALGGWEPSPDGTKLLYAIQDGGSDWRTVRVMDVAEGVMIGDPVEWVKFSALDWAKDGSGYYYSRFPATGEGETFQALNTNHRVYFHRLGTAQLTDQLVYETPDQPELNHIAQVSDDGRYVVITSSSGTDDRYEVTLIDREHGHSHTLVPGFEHSYSYVGNVGDTFFFTTNDGAPMEKVVKTTIGVENPEWTTVIPEAEETLGGVSLVGGKLVASYLRDAKSQIEIFDLEGNPVREVALPGIGTAGGFGGDTDADETFYYFTSYNQPAAIYRYDMATGDSSAWAEPEVAFDPDAYVVEQQFYQSKDGTRVPMFIVRSKEVAESGEAVPTLLYGYGGFNISLTPGFSPSRLAWMEAGGAYVVANIRGGGEYGKAWHDGGRLQNKQNTFDDFISAGEYLIAQGITPQGGLAINGGSNGGLLVGAVTNQRPDLFAAASPAVGVMDMVRFDRFTAGRYWVDDYGYPDKEADFTKQMTYSPYHNVEDGTQYPAVLVTTADTDDRVVPGHSFKYTAALQAADLGDKPQLIRIETRAGHGSGKPTDKAIEEAADILGFLGWFTGLEFAN